MSKPREMSASRSPEEGSDPTLSAVPAERYSQETLLAFAGGDYEEFIASGGKRLRPRLARALELGRLSPGLRVLDLACGRGEITLHALLAGAWVVAGDYSWDCLTLTGRTLGLAPLECRRRVRLARIDATALPFVDGTFHRVFFLDVAEHLHQWQLERTLAETKRVLRPDGHLVLHTVPNRWALRYGYPLLRAVLWRLPRVPRTEREREFHVNEQSPRSLRTSLLQAGLVCRVWVENLTVEQAAWQRAGAFGDMRDASYQLFRHPALRAVARFAMRTPLRSIAGNDIFAVAWPNAARDAPGRRATP